MSSTKNLKDFVTGTSFPRKFTLFALLQALLGLWAFEVFADESDTQEVELCPLFRVAHPIKPPLDGSEKDWLCSSEGDTQEEKNESQNPWRIAPAAQRRVLAQGYLKDRGYHSPVFRYLGKKKNVVWVDPGSRSIIRHIRVDTDSIEMREEIFYKFLELPITSGLLDEITEYAKQWLWQKGYPCSTVQTQASLSEESVLVSALVQEQMKFGKLKGYESSLSSPYTRFHAFSPGHDFDSRSLELTQRRIESALLAERAFYRVSCSEGELVVHESLRVGKPNRIAIGVGANTEGAVIAKGSWKNVRLDPNLSSLEFSIFASSRLQQFRGEMNWFGVFPDPRTSLMPAFSFKHRNEEKFETVSADLGLQLGKSFDFQNASLNLEAGPELSQHRTIRGVGAFDSRLLDLLVRLYIQSKDHEYYVADPRKGYEVSLEARVAQEGLGSSISASRLSMNWKNLWLFNEYKTPRIILGTRGGVYALFNTSPREQLPASFLQYLGGASSLRGFGRLSVSLNSDGDYTTLFTGLESRFEGLLPWGLGPFAFLDAGLSGADSLQLNSLLYWSPGLGLRWLSPIGVFRVSFGVGFKRDQFYSTQAYLSFGEEF